MDLIKNYNKTIQDLYDHVGFVEDWVVLPIDDRTEYYWEVSDEGVLYSEERESIINDDGNYYYDDIYTQRFYNKYVYIGEKYTAIMVDTHVDGNRFLAFYDNDKEMKPEE